ncbi:MAG TPA: PDZ domain-containing protein [Bryobacteraceae bacterium]|nr:PDZ domain-containing protein [Bryobacteraceae bacterium]
MKALTVFAILILAAQAQAQTQRSFLGVAVVEVTTERAKALQLREERGVEVTRIEDDSPASRAGLRLHDVVLEYQGQRVEGTEQFVRLVRETPAGREVKLLISRNGQPQTVTAAVAARRMKGLDLGELNIAIPRIPDLKWRSSPLGVEAESLNSQLAEFFGVKEGVLVRSVAKGSPAEKAGMKAGDVIVKVDDRKVASPLEIVRTIRSRGQKSVPVAIVREKKETTVTVTVEDDPVRGRTARLPQF